LCLFASIRLFANIHQALEKEDKSSRKYGVLPLNVKYSHLVFVGLIQIRRIFTSRKRKQGRQSGRQRGRSSPDKSYSGRTLSQPQEQYDCAIFTNSLPKPLLTLRGRVHINRIMNPCARLRARFECEYEDDARLEHRGRRSPVSGERLAVSQPHHNNLAQKGPSRDWHPGTL